MSSNHLRRAGTVAVIAASCATALAAGATAGGHATVRAARNAHLGKTILVDAHGRTLYHRKDETSGHFVCVGSCTSLWPPLTVRSRSALHAGGMKGLTAVRRPEGTLQVAYRGEPLYRFANDRKAGDANGQGFLNVWFAIPARRASAHHGSSMQQGGSSSQQGSSTSQPSGPGYQYPPAY